MYGVVRDSILIYSYELVFKDEDGNTINEVEESKLISLGFKEVIDIKPSFNEETEYLSIKSYAEEETSIIINYEVLVKEKSEQEKIKELEDRLKVTQDALDFILMGM